MTSTPEPGFVDGKHYTEHVSRAKSLLQTGQDERAEALLLRLVDAVEAEAKIKRWSVAPWYYEQLARIYRDADEPEKERAILKRFLAMGARIDELSDPNSRRLIELRNAPPAATPGEPKARASRGGRVSLSKKQAATDAGSELLALCQTVTEDGRLSEEEVAAFRDWLARNRDCGFAAQPFINATVERILEDGKVTEDEGIELYRAVEAILPPELRRHAARRRQEVTYQRDGIIDSYDFMVAGVHHAGRGAVIEREVRADEVAYLIRGRGSAHSKHAVEVRSRFGSQIGFVPEQLARGLAPQLDRGCLHVARVKKSSPAVGYPFRSSSRVSTAPKPRWRERLLSSLCPGVPKSRRPRVDRGAYYSRSSPWPASSRRS